MFIIEQGGLVKIIKNGKTLTTPFLDVSAWLNRVPENRDSSGMWGLMGVDTKANVTAEKNLDRPMKIPYIHVMIIVNLLTLKHVLRAAWRTNAAAEGGFY